MMRSILFLLFQICLMTGASAQKTSTCHLKNPLCFYGTDILSYLQVLHQTMQYEKMVPYITGPVVDDKDRHEVIDWLSELNWAYTFQRIGIREMEKGKWVINYKRNRMHLVESMKITCLLKEGICRVWLDDKTARMLFPPQE